jgi:archaellum component FlaC
VPPITKVSKTAQMSSSTLKKGADQLTPQEEKQNALLQRVTEESVQKSLIAFKMSSDLAIEIEGIGIDVNQTRTGLERLENKIDRLLTLTERLEQMAAGR